MISTAASSFSEPYPPAHTGKDHSDKRGCMAWGNPCSNNDPGACHNRKCCNSGPCRVLPFNSPPSAVCGLEVLNGPFVARGVNGPFGSLGGAFSPPGDGCQCLHHPTLRANIGFIVLPGEGGRLRVRLSAPRADPRFCHFHTVPSYFFRSRTTAISKVSSSFVL